MAKKISQLTQATQVKSDDVTVIVQDGETKKLPLNMMVTKQDIENKKVAGLAKLDEIEATYENDTYTPTITVKNRSSVKVGEGDGVDYSANVMDGHAKSAILSGATLVNLPTSTLSGNLQANYVQTLTKDGLSLLKPSTKYFLKIFNHTDEDKKYTTHPTLFVYQSTPVLANSSSTYIISTNSDVSSGSCLLRNETNHDLENSLDVLLIEYQEGMENWDIPYFEGMQSVKMPVLTTTGKNLFDGEVEEGVIDGNTGEPQTFVGRSRSKNFIRVPKNTDLYIKVENATNESWTTIYGYDENKKYLGMIISSDSPSKTFNTGNASYIKWKNNAPMDTLGNIQLEKGSTATPYEPYKTNILTVNEEVELRGIGDVRDELNLMTGELTQRVGEVVLDGSEDWEYTNKTFRSRIISDKVFEQLTPSDREKIYLICDKYKSIKYSASWDSGEFIALHISKQIVFRDERFANTQDWKQYLSQNPLTVQYQLATEKSIKTVDLIPSGTHPSTTPYCWKDGHIQLSSSGLLPSLEYSVVTSRAGQISQNAAMIVKNDKRIFDLEILLAGGLVNTTYQALTLQNQVETGLSKVSLSSEKEPDYLLYHMIMKLIEEKAYKLDDLTEKVSVFYLYEKLSDEQFETIYSELYPFVEEEYIELPEDGEIIEEPIVDEVLEEVENGVVM